MRWVLALSVVTVASCGLSAVGTGPEGDAGQIDGRDGTVSPVGGDASNPTTGDGSTPTEDAATSIDGASADGSFVCPVNYLPIIGGSPGSHYRYDSTLTTWTAAETQCEAEGTHLAVISSAGERDAVLGIATTEIWVGSTDRKIDGTWRDVTGGVTTYFNWDSSEPSTADEDDCMLLRKLDENGTPLTMDAKPCQAPTPHAFVCECDGLPALPGTAY